MIDFMLQQFRQVVSGFNDAPVANLVEVLNSNFRRPAHTHHQIGKAKAVVPEFYLAGALPGNVRVDERSAKARRLHPNKNDALENAYLGSGYPSSEPGRFAKAGQRLAQITNDRFDFS